MSSILKVVKGSPLFRELYDEEIMKIVGKCRVLSLEKGQYVFKEGDEGDDLYIILGGSARVMKNDVELAHLKKGDLFGELVLLNENIRSADVVSDNFTDFLMMSYNDIFGLYKHEPKIFAILILNLSRLLTLRLKNAGETIKDLNSVIEGHKKAS